MVPEHNLPIQLTSFIGRWQEVEELGRLLADTRLLTLTGAGGVGKTRLALHAARELLLHFPDGVWLVALASLTQESLIASATALTLGLGEDPSRPPPVRLTEHLRDKTTLLVLDNCEHLIGGSAALAERLLRTSAALRILATSREALKVPGEIVWPVPPLSLPEPERRIAAEEALQVESVQLFVERARAVWPRFVLDDEHVPAVARICQRLDGIPLAIELAAARVPVLSPREIDERLDDRFRLLTAGNRTGEPRHQTLRALCDWSYELLSEQERLLFRRLAVFAGGWTLEAAEAICTGGGVDQPEVLRLLAQLVDKSLVVVMGGSGETRYSLLETLRQYAAEKLNASGEASDLRQRHLRWFRGLAERLDPRLQGPEYAILSERLETEFGNIRAALEWSKAQPAAFEEGLRLSGGLMRFWWYCGRPVEALQWLSLFLALASLNASGSDGPRSLSEARAVALTASGFMARACSDFSSACAFSEEALALWRELGDRSRVAYVLRELGQAAVPMSDLDRAAAALEESLALARELRSRPLIYEALYALGLLAQVRHEHERARALYEESLALAREQGDPRRVAQLLIELAELDLVQDSPPAACARLRESLSVSQRAGLRVGFAPAFDLLARLAVMELQPGRALGLAGAAAAAANLLGAQEQAYTRCRVATEPYLAAARRRLGDAAAAAARAEGNAMNLEQALAFALERLPARPALPDGLTEREVDVLRLLAMGESNREIAEHLVLSPRTAERHVANIYRKISARRRADAVAYALRLGLSEPLRGLRSSRQCTIPHIG